MKIKNEINGSLVFKAIVMIILGAVLLVTAYLAVSSLKEEEEIAYAGQTVTDYEESKAIYLNGEKYLPDPDVYTFLLGGVDKFGDVEDSGSYKNSEQIDFIAVLAYNQNENTCKILMINRDTMTDVPVLGLGGKSAGTSYEQIALAHTYGSGLKDSADNTVNAVEKLLGGITIDNYAIMKMDAIPLLSDLVGGVPVTIAEDLTAIDPSFSAGTPVNLSGDLALQFVRRRMDVADGTNLSRIGRQEQYINGFYYNLRARVTENNSFLSSAFGEIEDYLVTDCDYVQMSEFQNYIVTYPEATLYTIAGQTVQGEHDFIEFYPDKAALEQLTVELFYEKAEQ